ncbi:MAG: VWA domain-containing protein [Vicinamibacterales bacterium]
MRVGRARSRILIAAAVVWPFWSGFGGQGGAGVQQPVGTTFRTSSELVALNVTVTDNSNQHVRGLAKEDFAVFEDGVPQEIVFFAASAVPLDLVIMLDTSSSMSDKLSLVQEAAAGLLGVLRPGDVAEVVGFSENAVILQPFTSDRRALEDAIRATSATGSTSLHNALYIVLQELRRMSRGRERDIADVRRQAVVVLSDGNDTASLISFEDVLESVKRSGVAVYPISIMSGWEAEQARAFWQNRSYSESAYALKAIARESGALSFFPKVLAELGFIYKQIASELSMQYSIGYPPRNPGTDGSFRRIIVRLVNHPNARPRTRSGYYAASAASAWNRK